MWRTPPRSPAKITSSLCSTKCTPPESGLTRSAPLLRPPPPPLHGCATTMYGTPSGLGPVDRAGRRRAASASPAAAIARPPAVRRAAAAPAESTAPRPPKLPAPSGSMRTQSPSRRVRRAAGCGWRSRQRRRCRHVTDNECDRSSHALTPSKPSGSAGFAAARRRLEKLRALLVVRVAGQPLPRLVGRRQPVVAKLVGVWRPEHGRIGPGERRPTGCAPSFNSR